MIKRQELLDFIVQLPEGKILFIREQILGQMETIVNEINMDKDDTMSFISERYDDNLRFYGESHTSFIKGWGMMDKPEEPTDKEIHAEEIAALAAASEETAAEGGN